MSEKVSEVVARARRGLRPDEIRAELAEATLSKLRPFAAVTAGLAALLAFLLLTARAGSLPDRVFALVYVFTATAVMCLVPVLLGPARLARLGSPHVSGSLLVLVAYTMIGTTTIAQSSDGDGAAIANLLLVMVAAVVVTTSWWTYAVNLACAVTATVAIVVVTPGPDGWYPLEVLVGLAGTAALVRWRRRAVIASARERREVEIARDAAVEALAAQRSALEINDVVVQGLASGLYALDEGDVDAARVEIGATLESARRLVATRLGQESLLQVLAELNEAPAPLPERELASTGN